MPNNPSVMLLDVNRVGTHWFWISLLLMIVFIAGPIYAAIKLFWSKDRPAEERKSGTSLWEQSGTSGPQDMETRD